MPRTPAFNEADVSDKPARDPPRPLIGPQRITAVTENYRQRLESLLAVDEGVASIVRALAGERRARADALRLHRGQRLLPRRAPHPEREGAALRAVRARAARDARPGRPARGPRCAARRQRRPRGDDPRRRRREARPDAGRGLAARLDARPHALRGATCCSRRRNYVAIHTPRYVYVEHNTGERELYDLRATRTSSRARTRTRRTSSSAQRPGPAAARAARLPRRDVPARAGARRHEPLRGANAPRVGRRRDVRLVTRVDWIVPRARGRGRPPAPVPGEAPRRRPASCARSRRSRRPPRVVRPPPPRLPLTG